MRISNFFLWQLAYTEIYVTETLWPDFREREYLAGARATSSSASVASAAPRAQVERERLRAVQRLRCSRTRLADGGDRAARRSG